MCSWTRGWGLEFIGFSEAFTVHADVPLSHHLCASQGGLQPQSVSAAFASAPGVIGRKPISTSEAAAAPLASGDPLSQAAAQALGQLGPAAAASGALGFGPAGGANHALSMALLEASVRNMPQAKDSERPKAYTPV